jgi:hypothetical protein
MYRDVDEGVVVAGLRRYYEDNTLKCAQKIGHSMVHNR